MSDQPIPMLHPGAVLGAIAARSCETFTTGPGSCFRNGRVVLSRYGADSVCDPCLAWAAIHRDDDVPF